MEHVDRPGAGPAAARLAFQGGDEGTKIAGDGTRAGATRLRHGDDAPVVARRR